ncbi:ribonuclease G [Breznakibacter xylanolyticus]|uniref:Ribonuclease G n=1 Tax=Breznakibacter xylanolyticus TaxID=990 RepID=A0A2W7NJL7_9BACT|nr:Rne/Rng family ribonuclease [Breznakibacter xylanolyticus]MBN2743564.1 Rne/Rng family ribonuclease [Marinilabiliaceae bacterium]PZX16904.1 ribonuclease G [Breznakibacter xylanolyticus]
MSAELFVDVTPEELTIALLEDKRLVEMRKEKSNIQFQVGDIYLAKIKKIMPGLNAAFVDVGYEKDAFLHYLDLGPQVRSLQKFLKHAQTKKGVVSFSKLKPENDINKEGAIADVLTAGQEILVQIAKEPISTKGPRLTSELSIAGRNLVLMPFSDKVSVSQKIESAEERNRLKRLLLSIKPKNYGVIVRTVAEGRRVAELDQELKMLVNHWEESTSRLFGIKSPSLVMGEIGRITALLRDILSPSFHSIVVNDPTVYREIKEYVTLIAPERESIVKLHKGSAHIFEHYGIAKQIKSLFGRTASFKSGAYLIIDHTEALHVIDVNSGNRSKSASDQETNALEVNMAAADEIARQLRLRDMGGIIVVDFIDMQLNENKQKVYERMKEAMASDRTKHNILPLSKFGLMQITRQRVRPELSIATSEVCPTCHGTGNVQASILLTDTINDRLRFVVNDQNIKNLTLKVHPYVYAYLKKGFPSSVLKWKFQLSWGIKVVPSESLGILEYKIFDENNKKEVDLK